MNVADLRLQQRIADELEVQKLAAQPSDLSDSDQKRQPSKFEKILKGRVIIPEYDKEKLWKMVKDPNFNECKKPQDHGRLWFKCSGAYA